MDVVLLQILGRWNSQHHVVRLNLNFYKSHYNNSRICEEMGKNNFLRFLSFTLNINHNNL